MPVRRPRFIHHGIEFQRAEIVWEDAFRLTKESLHKIIGLLQKNGVVGPTPSTFCYFARIGNHMLLVQEYEPASDKGDFTVVPLKPRIKIERA